MMNQISGHVDPAFAQVREVFAANFAEDAKFQEVGAGLCVYAGGQQVVDLWGGTADTASGRAWTADTLVHVFSTTKALPSVAVAQLVDQGRLRYDARVAEYWPEFAAAGKEDVTIAHLLSHQSGVNAFETPMTLEDLGDWQACVTKLAAQAPFCRPGEETAYHALTFGYLVMEVVRRVTGLMPREYVRTNIAGPLKADISIGADPADWSRVATLVPPPPPANRPAMNPQAAKAVTNPMIPPPATASPFWRSAEIPAVNGHVSARGIARLWATIAHGGTLDGVTLLSRAAVEGLSTPLSTRPDLMMGPGSWGAGVLINRGGLFGPLPDSFGNCGFGGSFGFANVGLDVAAGYTPNRLFPSVLQDPRAMAINEAVIACAGRAGA